jgi:hypothetical protein
MQIATHVLAYNVSRYIRLALRNMAPHVDKIYVVHSRQPLGYNREARNSMTNPTSTDEIRAAGLGDKVEIIEGVWAEEEGMRNACLARAKAEGFDWLLIQDADEFYTDKGWSQIKGALARGIRQQHYTTTWYNFWKSSHYVLVSTNGEIKECNAGFAVRCKSDLQFKCKRMTNSPCTMVIDSPCYHYGYVMSDEEMYTKIKTWSHAADFNSERWYRLKWLNWTEATRNLHPTDPTGWNRAIRFPLEQPEFAEEFALPVLLNHRVGLADVMRDGVYNTRAVLRVLARKGKKILKDSM